MLEVKALCKRYRGIPAIEDVSFCVGAGGDCRVCGAEWVGKIDDGEDYYGAAGTEYGAGAV